MGGWVGGRDGSEGLQKRYEMTGKAGAVGLGRVSFSQRKTS